MLKLPKKHHRFENYSLNVNNYLFNIRTAGNTCFISWSKKINIKLN